MAEEDIKPETPDTKFNMGVARVVRIDSIITLIHEYSIMALDGDYNKFASWKNALGRLYMEIFVFLTENEKEKIKTIRKNIDNEISSLNINLNELNNGNRDIILDFTKLTEELEEEEGIVRNSTRIRKMLFPEEDDPRYALK